MSNKAKCLVTWAGICLLTACGPAGNPDVSTEENDSAKTAASVVDTQAVNSPPQITSVPVTEVIPGLPYFYQPTAAESDGDTLAWSLSQAPSGMQIDTATGLVVAQALPAGKHAVSLKVADGQGGVDEQKFTIDLPSGPVILSTPPQYTYLDTNYQYQLEAVDASGSGLQYAIDNGPAGMQIGPDGLLEWTADQEGRFEIKLSVIDATGGVAEQTFVLNVLAPDGITIVSTPVTEAWVSTPYEYSLAVIDASGTMSYSFEAAPADMTVDTDGVILWTPTGEGSYPVKIRATNGIGGSTEQEFVIEVSSLEKMDALFGSMVKEVFASLSAGDATGAMFHLTPEAQQRLGPALDGLTEGVLTGAQYSTPVRVSINANSAEYMVRRTTPDAERIFMITFVRDQNQQWKIEDL